MTETKTQRVNLRVTGGDDELFRRAASVSDESLSEFLVESGRERAERLLADRNRFVLSNSEWVSFHEALDRPAKVSQELAELMNRRRPE